MKPKTMKLKRPAVGGAPTAAPTQSGGATIADRFKLEPVAAVAPARTVNKAASLVALIAGVVALAVSGLLVFNLSRCWEMLKDA